jgi:ERCC4-type nuclease
MTEEIPLLLIDDREDEDRIKEIGRRRLYQSRVERLPIGDYSFSGCIFEFKTCSDFLSSMTSGHLENQLNELDQYGQNAVLVICGNIEEVRYTRQSWRTNPTLWNHLVASYRGQIWSIMEKRQTRILQVRTVAEFCDFLAAKAKRLGKQEMAQGRPIVTQKSRDRTLEEEAQDCLCAITGVGREAAKSILVATGSVAGASAATNEIFMDIDGIGKIRAQHIREVLNWKCEDANTNAT